MSLHSALAWPAEEWAKFFRDAYREVLLRREGDAVTADDLYWASDALAMYEKLGGEAQALLREEKAVLDGVIHR
jgi:hypothetical protein